MDVNSTLKERGNTHGHFWDNAGVSSDLMRATRFVSFAQFDEQSVDIVQLRKNETARIGLMYILLKIARIVTGNWREVDHWRDIAGYATLVARNLAGEDERTGEKINAKETDKT